jgi:hypothetical protein
MVDIAIINTGLLAGVFFTGLFWIVRTIKRDRKEERDKNPTLPSNI